jgi:hypothetical protein
MQLLPLEAPRSAHWQAVSIGPVEVQRGGGRRAPEADTLADGVSGRGLPIVGYTPPPQVIADVQRLLAAANIEVGGVEYLVNARDGQVYYYDVNALSNFVANAPQVIGFDPFPRLVDYLLARAGLTM